MGWNFDNSYVQLPKVFYTKQAPTPVEEPSLVFFNGPLAKVLGLETQELINEEGTAIFAGNQLPQKVLYRLHRRMQGTNSEILRC